MGSIFPVAIRVAIELPISNSSEPWKNRSAGSGETCREGEVTGDVAEEAMAEAQF